MTSLKSATVPLMRSELTCPSCGVRQTQIMPIDACIVFFECPACGALLRPKAGDCCVFCSYGSVPCPPIQLARGGEDLNGGCCG